MKKKYIVFFIFFCSLFFCNNAYAYTKNESIISNGHGNINATYLVVHETANPGASAYNHVIYWKRNQPNIDMTHYVMELDGSIVYHTQKDNTLAYHVGNGNRYTVGIELTHATDYNTFNKQYIEAIHFCGDYLKSHNWKIDRLISHNDARYIWGGTTHTDPLGYFSSYGKSWNDFKNRVNEYINGSVPTPTPNPSPTPTPNPSPTPSPTPDKSVEEGARLVMLGYYGNVPSRYTRLQADGYDAKAVQDYVNRVYYNNGSNFNNALKNIARRVYRGDFGNNPNRSKKLRNMGYDPFKVQRYVNRFYYGF